MELINHKNAETYAITQRTSSKEDQVLYKKFSSASKVVRLMFAQQFITIFNCHYHTSNHVPQTHFLIPN
jgi:hypothetical protein